MKHLHLFEGFILAENINLDITNQYDLDLDNLTLTVYYDSDHWDDQKEFKNALKYAARNENDSLTDDLDDALSKHGLAINAFKRHTYGENGWVTYKLVRMSPMWTKIK